MGKNDMEEIINEYGKKVYSFCTYLTKSRQEADDLYQQTFLVAIEKDEINLENNPLSYLISIAVNTWNNQKRKFLWRKNKANVINFEDESLAQIASTDESIEVQYEKQEMREIVKNCVQELPEKMKVVILMFYMEEMSIEEIANALNIPAGTVKSRLHQGKMKLKERLVAYEN